MPLGGLVPRFHSLLWLMKVKTRLSIILPRSEAQLCHLLFCSHPLRPPCGVFAWEEYFWIPGHAPNVNAGVLSHRKAALEVMLEPGHPPLLKQAS